MAGASARLAGLVVLLAGCGDDGPSASQRLEDAVAKTEAARRPG